MNTTENNKLIAEFLQVDKNENGTFELPQYCKMTLGGNFKTEFTADNLQYHKNWNWLMEVVEKISHKGIAGGWIADIKDGLINANIENTFNACVEFIKWYNLQNK